MRCWIASTDSLDPIKTYYEYGSPRWKKAKLRDFVIEKKRSAKTLPDLDNALIQFFNYIDPWNSYTRNLRLIADDIEICRTVWDSNKYDEMQPFRVVFNPEVPLNIKKQYIEIVKKYRLGVASL